MVFNPHVACLGRFRINFLVKAYLIAASTLREGWEDEGQAGSHSKEIQRKPALIFAPQENDRSPQLHLNINVDCEQSGWSYERYLCENMESEFGSIWKSRGNETVPELWSRRIWRSCARVSIIAWHWLVLWYGYLESMDLNSVRHSIVETHILMATDGTETSSSWHLVRRCS